MNLYKPIVVYNGQLAQVSRLELSGGHRSTTLWRTISENLYEARVLGLRGVYMIRTTLRGGVSGIRVLQSHCEGKRVPASMGIPFSRQVGQGFAGIAYILGFTCTIPASIGLRKWGVNRQARMLCPRGALGHLLADRLADPQSWVFWSYLLRSRLWPPDRQVLWRPS